MKHKDGILPKVRPVKYNDGILLQGSSTAPAGSTLQVAHTQCFCAVRAIALSRCVLPPQGRVGMNAVALPQRWK